MLKKVTIILMLVGIMLVGIFVNAEIVLAKDPIELKMWHWAANKEAFWDKVIKDYELINPDVVVKQRVLPRATYHQTLTSAQIAGEGPDLIHAEPAGEVLHHLNNGQIIDLTPYFDDEWKSIYYPSTLSSFKINDKYYNVSLATNNMQVFYNVDAFKKAGVEIPIKTVNELISAVQKLRSIGMQGISFRGVDTTQMSHWFTVFARQMYPEKFKAADQGNGSFNIPEFVDLVSILDRLFDATFVEGFVGMSEDAARTLFTSGKASMFVSGNWSIRSMLAEKPDFEIGVFQIPALTPEYDPTCFGSLAGTWSIYSQSNHIKETVEFIKWACTNYSGELVKEIGLCPAGPPGEKYLDETPQLTRELADDQANAISRDGFNVEARNAIGSALQGLVTGQLTPAQVLEKAQKVKEE